MQSNLVRVYGTRVERLVVLCEHAGNRLPEWCELSPADAQWLDTHWGYDIGAANVARSLASAMNTTAVCAEFSRLVCDPNRPVESESWIRRTVEDDEPVRFNANVLPEDRRRREALWRSYHERVDQVLSRSNNTVDLVFSVHSMTSRYNGALREMELAVLYSDDGVRAKAMADSLKRSGFTLALNEPYSGFDGLIYSAERHGRAHGIPYLEVEVRNDLLTDDSRAEQIAVAIEEALLCVLE
ncbi:MAG: N-formylglutamate amidohydrolase [Myxococcota bacterium]